MSFTLPPKADLAVLPTRLERLERYSARLGREIWIKRDDLTEAGAGGNKIRKLQFLIRAALDEGADTLLTCGGIQSNHARTTAIAGRRVGLESVLVLRGSPADALEGNYLLDRLVGAEVVYASAEEYERRSEVLAQAADDLRRRGRRPYVIPEGGSNALGAMGYVEMIGETREQMEAQGVSFDSILCPVGSGGTLAGILMGIALYGLKVQVYGVNVQRDAEYFIEYVDALFEEAVRDLGFPVRVPREAIKILEGYVGLGYVEMKRDQRSGEFFLIEPNVGRPTGRSAIAEAGGVELLHSMYCDLAGLPLPTQRSQTYGQAKWIYLRHDLQAAYCAWRRGELTIRDWWTSVRGPKSFAVLSLRDPLPFLYDLLGAASQAMTRLRAKPHRPEPGVSPVSSQQPDTTP